METWYTLSAFIPLLSMVSRTREGAWHPKHLEVPVYLLKELPVFILKTAFFCKYLPVADCGRGTIRLLYVGVERFWWVYTTTFMANNICGYSGCHDPPGIAVLTTFTYVFWTAVFHCAFYCCHKLSGNTAPFNERVRMTT